MNNSINKIGNNIKLNFYQPVKCERKIKQAQTCDSVSFSGKPKVKKETIINKLKKILKKDTAPTVNDIEKAKNGFAAYQYQSAIINTALRRCDSAAEAVEVLKNISRNALDMESNEAYFVEKGFDILSKPLPEDTTVYRYIYSSDEYNVDWQIGDKITEKAFMSTTSDGSDESYSKNYVKQCLKNYNSDTKTKGNFYTLEINIPKGTKVVKGNEFMNEVLLKYGSTLEVTDFDEETNTYKCNLVK